jgi:hypothetical protein
MKVRAPQNPGFGEINDNCRPVQPLPDFTVTVEGQGRSLASGQSVTIRTSEAADFRLVRWDGSSAPRNAPLGTLTPARDGRSALYTAPAVIAAPDIIIVIATARAGAGRSESPFLGLVADQRVRDNRTEAWSDDLDAVEINANVILKGTKVDGVYDKDPVKEPDAVRYDRLTYLDVLKNELKVMDTTAISLCMDNKLPIVVFNIKGAGNLMRVVKGENIGTTVS